MAEMDKRTIIKYLSAVAVTVISVWFLLSYVDMGAIVSFLFRMDPFYILLAFLVYYISIVFRVLRFRYLLHHKLGFRELHDISVLHNFFTSILPSVTGELSYVYMVGKTKKVSLMDNIGSLLVARIFDFISFYFIIGYALFFIQGFTDVMRHLLFISFIVISFLISALVLFMLFEKQVLHLLGRFIAAFRLERWLGSFHRNGAYLRKTLTFRTTAICLFISFITWGLAAVSNFFVFLATGVQFSLFKIFFAGALLKFLSTLPVQGFAGFGTSEGFWAAVFSQMGLDLENSILTGFAAHAVSLGFVISLAGLVFLFRLVRPR